MWALPMKQAADIYLVTGFLGAGKTTFLKDRLADAKRRIGVLVNDFGKINFDSLRIGHQGLTMVELNNGSIFCSCLKDDFIDGLVRLIGSELDDIYIESSGLADPSDMGRILDVVRQRSTGAAFRFCGTICLVDALHILKILPKMLSAERQVRHSHLLVINKCDLIGKDQLRAVRSALASLNPQARIIETQFGRVSWPALPDSLPDIPDEETTNRVDNRNKHLVLHILHEPDAAAFCAFLKAIGSHFFRVKGMIRLDGQICQVDLVNHQIQIEPIALSDSIADDVIGQLVCLTSQGLESLSHLARMADCYLPGLFSLEM